jgi:hypothetical protein
MVAFKIVVAQLAVMQLLPELKISPPAPTDLQQARPLLLKAVSSSYNLL